MNVPGQCRSRVERECVVMPSPRAAVDVVERLVAVIPSMFTDGSLTAAQLADRLQDAVPGASGVSTIPAAVRLAASRGLIWVDDRHRWHPAREARQ